MYVPLLLSKALSERADASSILQHPFPLPSIDPSLPPTSTTAPEVDPRVVMLAERMQHCEELDMEQWRAAVEAARAHAER